MMSSTRLACAFLAVLGLWSLAVCGYAADQKTPAPAAPPAPQAALPPASTTISVAEIATQSATATEFLRTLTSQLVPSAEIDTIRRALPEASRIIDLELTGTVNILHAHPSLAAIAAQQELWKERQLQTSKWLSTLTQRATRLQEGLGRLGDLQARWSRAQQAAQAATAPAPVLQQVADLLAGIAATQAPLEAQLTVVLDLQSRVADQVARCGGVLAQIAQAQAQAMGGILVRDGVAIWSAEAWAQGRSLLRIRIRDVVSTRWRALAGRKPRQSRASSNA